MSMSIKGLKVIFDPGEANEKHAIENIDLEVADGEFVCILGSNGAGKSTLLSAILGRIPYQGNIFLNGKPLDKEKQYKRTKRIGVVYQDPLLGTSPNLTVEENLILASREKGLTSRKKVKEFLIKSKEELSSYGLGIENAFKEPCRFLSGGMRQVITLYMATCFDSELLLLDEHTAALDPKTAEKVMDITNNVVASRNAPCLMITHNLDFALRYGNRLIVLKRGKILLDVKAKEKESLSRDDVLKAYGAILSDRTLLQN